MPYQDVLRSLEHLILSTPPGGTEASRRVMGWEEWQSRINSTNREVQDRVQETAVHVMPQFNQDPDVIAGGVGVKAFSVFRYSGVRATPYLSSNAHAVTWEVLLDVLVKGNTDPGTGVEWPTGRLVGELDVGVYSPARGSLIDYFVQRFMRNPILTPVREKSSARTDSDEALAVRSAPGYNPYERDDDATYTISSVQCADTTDLNYWTLLWTAGLPNSFLGWWPSTLTFTVTERVIPVVESYG